ncbi:DUF6879 family protein [Streptomyces sp. 5.8]|uniref:DUF6879 family protein n=1 Tax=Streptomyces sp. 5.8 TaxID=3406571 RepID=UPI003BB5270F
MTQNDVVPGFDILLDGAQHSALHLEMRDGYGVAAESAGFAGWLATGLHLAHVFSLGAKTSLRYTTAVAVSAAEHESVP